jgi:hypothetical protein
MDLSSPEAVALAIERLKPDLPRLEILILFAGY